MQTHDNDPQTSGLENALTLLGSAIAIGLLIAIGSQIPDLLLALAR
jgi:hypothetical protein